MLSARTSFFSNGNCVKKSRSQKPRVSHSLARADAVQSAILDNMEVKPERVFRSERLSGKGPMADVARMELSLE